MVVRGAMGVPVDRRRRLGGRWAWCRGRGVRRLVWAGRLGRGMGWGWGSEARR